MPRIEYSKSRYVEGYNGPGKVFFYPEHADIVVYQPNPNTNPTQKILGMGDYRFTKDQTIHFINTLKCLLKEFDL